MKKRQVFVVGGGWAGLAAATRLTENGIKVTLFEQSDSLGGRCASFWDENFEEWLDIGTHAFLGAYNHTFALLKRWGVDYNQHLNFVSEVAWLEKNGRSFTLTLGEDENKSRSSKRKKLQSLAALMLFKGMSFKDRLKTAKVLDAMVNFLSDRYYVEPTIANFLREYGIGRSDCGGLWTALTQAVFNGQPEVLGLYPLVNAVKEGLMIGGTAARIGVMKSSFKELLIDPAEKYLKENGVDVIRGSRITETLINDNGKITGVETDNQQYSADLVILALPPDSLLKLLPAGYRSEKFFQRFAQFETAPIATVHLRFKSAAIKNAITLFPKSFTQWLFVRGSNALGGWRTASAVISDAPRKGEMSLKEIETAVLNDLDHRFKGSLTHQIIKVKTVRYPDATVLLKPGSKELRPSPATPIKGLYLAGDWCDTGLPATIESAARSGELAANEVLELV